MVFKFLDRLSMTFINSVTTKLLLVTKSQKEQFSNIAGVSNDFSIGLQFQISYLQRTPKEACVTILLDKSKNKLQKLEDALREKRGTGNTGDTGDTWKTGETGNTGGKGTQG